MTDTLKRQLQAEYDKKRNQNPERKKRNVIYQRTHRIKHAGRYKARKAVTLALKKGILVKKPCEECGVIKVEGHHIDYRKPLTVQWLCRIHHLLIEGKHAHNITRRTSKHKQPL